jgi:hypothetical protein
MSSAKCSGRAGKASLLATPLINVTTPETSGRYWPERSTAAATSINAQTWNTPRLETPVAVPMATVDAAWPLQ